MPPLTDPVILAAIRGVLDNWHVTDYVTWKSVVRDWVGEYLPRHSLKDLARLMHDHVAAGGEIDQVRERRPEWNDRDYHYDFRIPVAGRLIYLETLLIDDDPTDPTLHIVSIHDA
jgi:hypothetical protein